MAILSGAKPALFLAPLSIAIVGAWSCAQAHGNPPHTRSAVSQAPRLAMTAGQDDDPAATRRSCATVLWCASGGAALVGEPALDKQERVYAATSDGYLHAFERDGRFRFSYTVQGTPLGSVSLRPSDGAILLGTTAGQIYAINQTGTLHFRHLTPTAVWSGLYSLNASSVVFLGLDWRLYALSNGGRALYRVRAPSVPTTEPVVADHDVVWVGLEGAVARFVSAYRLERIPLGPPHGSGPVEQVVTLGDAAVARASTHAYWIVSGQSPVDLGTATQLGSDGSHLAVAESQRLRLLMSKNSGKNGTKTPDFPREIATYDLSQREVSGALAVRGRRIVAPASSGMVSVFGPDGLECEESIADAPLRQPVLGASGKFLVVADYSGKFCAVELRSALE